jgi:hypothetical protein
MTLSSNTSFGTKPNIGNTLVGNAQQSVRLYGEVVPEPSALASLVIACFLLVGRVWEQRH